MFSDGIFFWFLGDAALKGSVVLAAACVLSAIFRKAPASARHLIWTAAVCSLLVLPALSYFTPAWDVPVSTVTVATDGPLFRVQAVPLADLPRLALGASNSIPRGRAADFRPAAGVAALRQGWVFALWTAGVVFSLVPMVLGIVAVRWRRRGATLVAEDAWGGLVSELARAAGLRRGVRVFLSSRTTMPMSTGVLRPAVVLPAEAADWPAERRRMVLLHELAHVQRRDCLTQSLCRLACSFYWFHPLAWFAARQAVRERERACDDLVLRTGARASDYAGELLEIARSMAAPRLAWASVAMARPAQLEGRLLAILDGRIRRNGLSRVAVWSAAAAAMLILLPIAAIRPVQAQVPALRAVLPALPAPELTQTPIAADTEAGRLVKQGDMASSQGRIEDAVQAYRSAAEVQKATYGEDSVEYAAALLRAARYMRAHGKFTQVESLFRTALPVYERVYGAANAEVADVYEYLGNVALKGGIYAKAGESFRQALTLTTRMAGEHAASVARLTALIGQVETASGNDQEAERQFLRATGLDAGNTPDRALALELYAQLLRKAQRTAEAERMEAGALAIRTAQVEASFQAGKTAESPLRVGDGVVPPRPEAKVEPEYGEQAWATKHQGTAVYSVVIGTDGTIHSASLKRSAGLGLDEKGAEALHQWKFQPGTKDGQPVAVQATVEVNFRLL